MILEGLEMIRKLSAAAAIALALSAGTALGADLPSTKAPPVYAPPPPVFSWTGFYVGVNLGGGWRDHNRDDNNWALTPLLFGGFPGVDPFGFPVGFVGFGNNNNNSGGVVGGGQIGYNFQFSPWLVVGVETDFQGTSIGSGGGNWSWWGNAGVRLPWFGTVRGRLGVTPLNPHFLIYGTGGFAYGEVQIGGIWNNWNRTDTGWTAGGGIEWAFLPNWSAKIEYLYTDLSDNNNNNGGGWGWDWGNRRHFRFNTVRTGVNYRFNFSPAPPVVAKF
jgi:outer membrane immunogenic protein